MVARFRRALLRPDLGSGSLLDTIADLVVIQALELLIDANLPP